MTIRHLSILAVVAVAGCSGGGGASSFSAYINEGNALVSAAAPLDILTPSSIAGVTDPAALPPTGVVAYDGVLALEIEQINTPNLELQGDLTLSADFTSDSFAGSVRSMVDSEDQRYSGSLSISDGFIDRETNLVEDFTYVADLEGAITAPDGTRFVTSESFIAGDFIGDDAEFIRGTPGGTVVANGQELGIGGLFIGQAR